MDLRRIKKGCFRHYININKGNSLSTIYVQVHAAVTSVSDLVVAITEVVGHYQAQVHLKNGAYGTLHHFNIHK